MDNGNGTGTLSAGVPSLAGTTTGVGVYLNNPLGASLSWMQLNDFDNAAILSFGSSGFTMTDTVISGNSGNDVAVDESAVFIHSLTGTGTITNSTIGGGLKDNLHLLNTSVTLNGFTSPGQRSASTAPPTATKHQRLKRSVPLPTSRLRSRAP